MDAYLDIETTGLSRYYDDITVVGIGLTRGTRLELAQLYDDALTKRRLTAALKGVSRLYTYNGSRFDLPFIQECLGLDVTNSLEHYDLMYDCWNRGLFGGLKAVEAQLGITRRVTDIGGLEAVNLWRRYKCHGDQKALDTLLEYNREDVGNLSLLRHKLGRAL